MIPSIEDRRIPDTWRTDLLRWSLLIIGSAVALGLGYIVVIGGMHYLWEWAFQ
jgi:hypothetical protein